jgi:PAS domain S-box-containing protein
MSLLHNLTSQELVDKIGVMVLVLDSRGRIEMINNAGCDLLGYARNELIGKDWVDHFILPEDQQDIADLFSGIIAGKEKASPYYRNTIIIRSGEKRLISWHNTVLTDEYGAIEGILSTGEDITVQSQAEEEIRQSEARYRHFFEHIPEGLFIFDSKGAIRDVNQLACERLGYTREELLGMNFAEVDFGGYSGKKEPGSSLLSRESWPQTYQGTHLEKNGQFFPVEVKIDRLRDNGFSSQYIVVARDISDRLFQAQRLQDNRDLIRIIIDAIPENICVKDGQGRWLLANTCAVNLYGLESVEYQGKTNAEIAGHSFLGKEVFHRCVESDLLAWQKQESLRSTESLLVKDGEKRFFDVIRVPLFHQDGKRKALVVIGRDITEQKVVEERYRKLFEQSPLAYISVSLDGEIIAVNQTVVSSFGYKVKELIGKKLTSFFTPQSKELFRDHFSRFINGEMFSGTDYEVIKANGDVATIMVTTAFIRDDSGNPVNMQCVAVDVTRQRLIEEQIRESEELYRLLFEKAPVGFVHYDTELNVISCNDHYCMLLEASREQLIGFNLNDLRDKQVLPALKNSFSGKEGRWVGEYQATLSDKKLFLSVRTAPLHDAHGSVRGGMAIIVDRSSKRRAETEKMLLMSAIGQTTETVVITDTEGVIEYVNPAFEKVTGFSAEEAVGQSPGILKSNCHDADFYKQMWQTLVKGQAWQGRITNRHKDGTLIEEDMTISPVRDQEGGITHYVAVKRDVTREISLEKQLHQAQKMEAIGTLAGGIAHDFNNILSAILGYADMVDRQLRKHDLNRRDIGRIIMAGKRAADLVKQILTFSRQKEADLRPVRLQPVIRDALKLLHSSLPATVQLRQEIDENCRLVRADPIRIHQVVMNLCTNARQAMASKQGKLVVRLVDVGKNVPMSNTLSSHPASVGWLLLEVSDSGSGLAPEIRQRIFEPFFSTRKKDGGTGLGLSVVHGIVKSHGGEIIVKDSEGGGATFQVYLPVIEGVELEEKQLHEEVAPRRGDEFIMVIDDEPLLVDVTKRMLVELGYTVMGFTDSREALQWFIENQDTPDLVITDMTMPYMTGAELAKKVLEVVPAMPVILCSGYSDSIDADVARELGIIRFIIKPVENRVLAEAVRLGLEKNRK